MKPIQLKRTISVLIMLAALSVGLIAFSAGDTTDAPPTDPSEPSAPTQTEPQTDVQAWFTAQQASRGAAQYRVNCSSCHGTELEGVFAPGLSGGELFGSWNTAGDLYGFFSVSMPPTAPGRLSDQAYTDILAFILSFNGYPAGDEELPTDPELFHQIDLAPVE